MPLAVRHITTGAGIAALAGLTMFVSAQSGENVPTVPTQLPVVLRTPAAQPPVGVPGDAHLDKTPPRRVAGLDLVRNGWTYNCMECHKLFTARWHYVGSQPRSSGSEPLAVLNEHKDIQLEHGSNRFCLNCHHAANRNAFVDYDGAEIAPADIVQLCAKCHGTIYRDWQAGVHGRENGFWQIGRGIRTRLLCIQCHDPHSPKFKAMRPVPPLRYPSRGAHAPSGAKLESAVHD